MSATPPPDTSVKVPHLVVGLLFLGVSATWALAASGVVDADVLPYLGPALLVAAGVVGLVVGVVSTRRSPDRPAQQPARQPADHSSVTMEDQPAPAATRRLEQDAGPDQTDPNHDGEPTAPLHRPEDLR